MMEESNMTLEEYESDEEEDNNSCSSSSNLKDERDYDYFYFHPNKKRKRISQSSYPTSIVQMKIPILKSNSICNKIVYLRALFDSGTTTSMISSNHVEYMKKMKLKNPSVWITKAGTFTTTVTVQIEFKFIECDDRKSIRFKFHVYNIDVPSKYDIIIGTDILKTLGITLSFENNSIIWENLQIPMKIMKELSQLQTVFQTQNLQSFSTDSIPIREATERLTTIISADYHKTNLHEYCKSSTWLKTEQQSDLYELLYKYKSLFDGTLGTWNTDPIHLLLKKDIEPYHVRRPYPIPQSIIKVLKEEVDRLVSIGVLKRCTESTQWAAPSFGIPKKNKTIRFISDFRELNKRLKRQPYPLPKIQDILLQLQGFQYASSIDLNMGYYHIKLDLQAQTLCTIILPWGKYQYMRLPMGIKISSDIFQEKMSLLMSGLDFVRIYIDDLLTIT